MLPPPAPAAPIHAHITSYPPTPTYSLRPFSRDSAAAAVSSEGGDHPWSRHSSRRHQRSPGIYVDSGRERIEMTAQPRTPRIPPQSHLIPRTALPSPSANLAMPYGTSPSPREHYNRPYHMDERPRLVRGFLPSPHLNNSSRHSRYASNSPQGSRYSPSPPYATADKEKHRRRHEAREDHHISRRTHELRERIKTANTQISDRHESAVKMQQPKHVSERRSRRDGFEEVVVRAMGRLSVEDKNWTARKDYQRGLDLEKEEQEA